MGTDLGLSDWIDAHVHLWTPDEARYPLAAGVSRANIRPPSFTPEELFSVCRPFGVTRIVLIQVVYYGFDNSYMLDCMAAHPGVFGAVAVIDWNAPRPDDEMLRMAKHGVRGFRVRSGEAPPEDWLETESLDRMFRCAADHGLAICPLMSPNGLPSLARMCERFPNTHIVIDHLCRVGGDGEIREADLARLCGMARYPEVRVKLSAFYQLGAKKPPHDELLPVIRRVCDAFSARRLMWASDSPLQLLNETYQDSITVIRDRCDWLTDEDRAWLLRGTAEAVFF